MMIFWIYIRFWRSTCVSELTPIIYIIELTHLGSEASIYKHFNYLFIEIQASYFPQDCDFKLAYHNTFGAQGPLGGGMAYLKTPTYGMNGLGIAMGHHSPMDPGIHPSVPYPQGKFLEICF